MKRTLASSIALLIAIAAAVAIWRSRDSFETTLAGAGRVTEARVSAFDYRPLQSRRSASGADAEQYDRLYRRLKQRAETDPSPGSLHELALLHLAARRVDTAAELLRRAVAAGSANAAVWSDLAAVELASGRTRDAAEYAARALEIDPEDPTAAFNWALAMENLANRPIAKEAWERYLTLDRDSEWAVEARQHLDRFNGPRPDWKRDGALLKPQAPRVVVEKLVRDYPQRSRAKALRELLPEFAADGDPHTLELLRTIAAVRAAAGDVFLQEAVEHTAANRTLVAEGLNAFGAGNKADEAIDMQSAGTAFRDAAKKLRAAGSPVAIPAAIYAARSDVYAARRDEALAQLREVDEQLAALGDRYPSMASESAWIRGLAHLQSGRPNECLESFRRGLVHARRSGETEHEVSISALIAAQLDTVADPADAEQARSETLKGLDRINADSRRVYTAYLETATSCLRGGRPRVALAFLDAALRIGHAEKNEMYIADCEVWRALALMDLQRRDEAIRAIEHARSYVPLIKTEGFRERTLGNIALVMGRIETSASPARAVSSFTEAMNIWERKGWRTHLGAAYFARGEVHRLTADTAAAERDYRAAIAEMEQQRQNLTEPELRITYFERADAAFVRLTELLLARGRVEEALSIVERKRARVLLDRIAAAPDAMPMDARAITAGVRGRVSLLHVALLEGHVQLWLTRNGRTTHARGAATREEIEEAVSRHLAAIANDDIAGMTASGRWLFDRLIGPVYRDLPTDSDLVIVPDGVLEAFPFATLVLPDGLYLIDRQPIVMTPSANVFLRATADRKPGTVLVVAQPAPSGFDPLPRASAEVSSVALEYRHAHVLVGKECSASRFVAEASQASLIHYAGHAKANRRKPSASALIFEATSDAPEELTAEAIARTRLGQNPLVVLAACDTGLGRVRRTEGVASLASAFLQAGAQGVIATLWSVEDDPTANLFRSFHRHYSKGQRAIDALRSAQRELLHGDQLDDRRPSVWGSSILIGTT